MVHRQIPGAPIEDQDTPGDQGQGDDDLDGRREVAEVPVPAIAGEADVEAVQNHPEGR